MGGKMVFDLCFCFMFLFYVFVLTHYSIIPMTHIIYVPIFQ